jgi:hAT family C-terminal dimerisation region
MMTHDIFIVLVSIIHSESCFSSANRILPNKRSRLRVKTFKQLVCLKDWFDAEQRNQHSLMEASSSSKIYDRRGLRL